MDYKRPVPSLVKSTTFQDVAIWAVVFEQHMMPQTSWGM